MRLSILFAIALLCAMCGPQVIAAGTYEIFKLPMTVTVVRGAGKQCEPLCPHWISAEGTITADTPAKFREALHSAGDLKLPVIINSFGGNFDAALEIAQLIRARGVSVGVATTGYTSCDPRVVDCASSANPTVQYKGFAVFQGYCKETCIFLLAAGQQRLVGSAMPIIVYPLSAFKSQYKWRS